MICRVPSASMRATYSFPNTTTPAESALPVAGTMLATSGRVSEIRASSWRRCESAIVRTTANPPTAMTSPMNASPTASRARRVTSRRSGSRRPARCG